MQIDTSTWEKLTVPITAPDKPFDLLITFEGSGTLDVQELQFN